jgi:hypothetical protein
MQIRDRYEQSLTLHNRFKLPVACGFTALGVLVAVFGVATGRWALTVIGALAAAGSVASIITIFRGRNPWWIRSPFDPPQPPA